MSYFSTTPEQIQFGGQAQASEAERSELLSQYGLLKLNKVVAKKTNRKRKDKFNFEKFLLEVGETPPHLMTTERLASLAVRLLQNTDFRDLVKSHVLFRGPIAQQQTNYTSVSLVRSWSHHYLTGKKYLLTLTEIVSRWE